MAILILAAAVLVLGEDFLAGGFDKATQNGLAAEMGVTKQGRQR